jgi:hypothetical protein
MKVPASGGAPAVFATTEGPAYLLAIDAQNVYWAGSNQGDASIVKAPIDGGAPTTLVTGQVANALAVDDKYVYWTNNGNYAGDALDSGSISGSVMRVPIDGGPPEPLASGLHDALGIAVNGSEAYFLGGGYVTSIPKAGGAPAPCDLGDDRPWLVTARDGSVYFVSGSILRITAD